MVHRFLWREYKEKNVTVRRDLAQVHHQGPVYIPDDGVNTDSILP